MNYLINIVNKRKQDSMPSFTLNPYDSDRDNDRHDAYEALNHPDGEEYAGANDWAREELQDDEDCSFGWDRG